MLRSASCIVTSRPKIVIGGPNGTTANARNPGIIAIVGAIR